MVEIGEEAPITSRRLGLTFLTNLLKPVFSFSFFFFLFKQVFFFFFFLFFTPFYIVADDATVHYKQ